MAGSGQATGEWETSPGQKAPLVASDSSSSGGSDSEEDPGENKSEGSSKTPANQTTAPARYRTHVRLRFIIYLVYWVLKYLIVSM